MVFVFFWKCASTFVMLGNFRWSLPKIIIFLVIFVSRKSEPVIVRATSNWARTRLLERENAAWAREALRFFLSGRDEASRSEKVRRGDAVRAPKPPGRRRHSRNIDTAFFDTRILLGWLPEGKTNQKKCCSKKFPRFPQKFANPSKSNSSEISSCAQN